MHVRSLKLQNEKQQNNHINDIKQISVKIVVVRKTYHAFLSL